MGVCRVVILLDTGGTHNFMDPSVLRKIQLQVTSTEGLSVKIANGQTIQSEGSCDGIALHIQGNSYMTYFYILTLGGCNVVLGI